jgi:hypothetical protein
MLSNAKENGNIIHYFCSPFVRLMEVGERLKIGRCDREEEALSKSLPYHNSFLSLNIPKSNFNFLSNLHSSKVY